jgi:hypothetical protein
MYQMCHENSTDTVEILFASAMMAQRGVNRATKFPSAVFSCGLTKTSRIEEPSKTVEENVSNVTLAR